MPSHFYIPMHTSLLALSLCNDENVREFERKNRRRTSVYSQTRKLTFLVEKYHITDLFPFLSIPWLYIIYCIANILHKRIAQFSSTFHSIQSRSSNKSFEREREKETQKQPKIDIDFWSLLIFRICENLVRNKTKYRNSIDGRRSDYVAGVCIHWVFADFTN